MKNSEKLSKLEVGDNILFKEGEQPFFVKAVDHRYALACTEDGLEYTVVDKKEKFLASTDYIFEEYANFNIKENTEKMLKALHAGEKQLSNKYRDTFDEFDTFKAILGSEVTLLRKS